MTVVSSFGCVTISATVIEALLCARRLTDEQSRDPAWLAIEVAAVLEEWANLTLQKKPLRVTPRGLGPDVDSAKWRT